VQLSHYLTDDLVVNIGLDQQTFNRVKPVHAKMNSLELDLTYFPSSDWQVRAGYRYEDGDRGMDDNHIFQIELIREF